MPNWGELPPDHLRNSDDQASQPREADASAASARTRRGLLEERDLLLHILRCPDRWSEDVVRETRLLAADELARLWRNETQLRRIATEITSLSGDAP